MLRRLRNFLLAAKLRIEEARRTAGTRPHLTLSTPVNLLGRGAIPGRLQGVRAVGIRLVNRLDPGFAAGRMVRSQHGPLRPANAAEVVAENLVDVVRGRALHLEHGVVQHAKRQVALLEHPGSMRISIYRHTRNI